MPSAPVLFGVDIERRAGQNRRVVSSLLKSLLLVLLMPVLCCGCLCNGSLPLCPFTHHCEHEETCAHALPLDACGHEHGEQAGEQHNVTTLQFVKNAEGKTLKPLGTLAVTVQPCVQPALHLCSAALPREVCCAAARPRYLGHLRPLRC